MQMNKTARRVAAVGALSMPLAFAVSGIAGAAALPTTPDLPGAPDASGAAELPGSADALALPGPDGVPNAGAPGLDGEAFQTADLVSGSFPGAQSGSANGEFSGSGSTGSGWTMDGESEFEGDYDAEDGGSAASLPEPPAFDAPAFGVPALPQAPAFDAFGAPAFEAPGAPEFDAPEAPEFEAPSAEQAPSLPRGVDLADGFGQGGPGISVAISFSR
ncbi:hypothetical protein ACVGVM_10985 [Pseudonocardia bannensis]|uniref:Uncharacterized protein n=1 Tax=Pseudonocardia bannensis TaxID=630973 RepID=A0A848DJW7_9PSEU|nr:hypothetical protein [Pseudonocardia bannensis]NMH93007.1 hypothetical protein [Pseudonocardia bannensis]